MMNPAMANKALCAGILFFGLMAVGSAAHGDPSAFFSTDFDSGVPAEFSGVTTTAEVQGWAGLGHGTNVFGGLMLHNDTGPYGGGPALPTRLTLTGLPQHDHIDLRFLLAIIDTWDGDSGGCAPDFEPDSAYDLGLEPALQAIPHTASTLTIEWFASGDGWQGSYDESWGIDNVEVVVWSPTPIQTASWGRVKSLYR